MAGLFGTVFYIVDISTITKLSLLPVKVDVEKLKPLK